MCPLCTMQCISWRDRKTSAKVLQLSDTLMQKDGGDQKDDRRMTLKSGTQLQSVSAAVGKTAGEKKFMLPPQLQFMKEHAENDEFWTQVARDGFRYVSHYRLTGFRFR